MLTALVLALAPATAAAANPRLAGMNIEIWPEYDRPAALVILHGEIAPDAKLPADVALRISSASGGPTAVAFADSAKGNLLNLQFERKDAKDFITLRFKAPQRYFQVEFYESFPIEGSERKYTYVWPGDFAVDRLSVTVQEPAGASKLSSRPELGEEMTGAGGLRYRSAALGPAEVGKKVPIEIRYTKTDPRLSAEVVKPAAPDITPQPRTFDDRGAPPWVFAVAVVTPLLLAFGAGIWWWSRRAGRVSAPAGTAGFCTTCGKAFSAGDRFCSACGTART